MSKLAAISATGLTKTYRVYERPLDRLRESLTRRVRHREFRALDDVSFVLESGEALGLVGENGAGKSTLLKILAGIVTPTAGSVQTQGTIASILELGSGFHPEFTGRQNAVLNAAMLGLSESAVQTRLPEILAWSELGEFVDQPVKNYSTGMTMRLGFSIATQVEPDILIIDEALSVGDGYFQKKCMDRLQELVARGTTLLFCSHAMYYISAFCQRALWLRGGKLEALGPAREVVADYEAFLLRKVRPGAAVGSASVVVPAPAEPAPSPARFGEIRPVAGGGKLRPGDPWSLEIAWQSADADAPFHLGVSIARADHVEVASLASHFDGLSPWSGRHDYAVRLELPLLPLVKGEFTLYVYLLDESGLHIYDQCVLPGAIKVENPEYRFGLVEIAHAWSPSAAMVAMPAMAASAR